MEKLKNFWDDVTYYPGVFVAVVLLLGVILFYAFGGASRNVGLVKQHAPQVLLEAGYEVVGYLGYTEIFSPVCGGQVWFTVKRRYDQSGLIYTVPVEWWFGEYHIYKITPVAGININMSGDK